MNNFQRNENRQAVKVLNKLAAFFNKNGVRVESAKKTPIGKKYVVVCGDDKKEIYLTKSNTTITHFHKDTGVAYDVVFSDNPDIVNRLNNLQCVLEKWANNMCLKMKIQRAFKSIIK